MLLFEWSKEITYQNHFLGSINNTIALDRDVALKYFEDVLPLDLDFSKHQAHLKSGHISVTSLMEYYDEIFGHSTTKIVEKYVGISWIAILGICFGLLLLVLIGMIALYGLTENGKTKYKNLYLYYFGKPADFEKRWRYSVFFKEYEITTEISISEIHG